MNPQPRIFGNPGGRARLNGLIRASAPLCFAIMLVGFAIGALMPWPATSVAVKCAVVAAVAILVFVFAVFSTQRIDAFFKGAQGEERIAFVLSRLPACCSVFHGVDLSGHPSRHFKTHDFDHLILTPSGIVIVETKNWTGPVTVKNGNIIVCGNAPTRDPITQVRDQSRSLKKWFEKNKVPPPRISSVICFAGDALDPAAETSLGGTTLCTENNLLDSVLAFDKDSQMSDSTFNEISRLLQGNV